MDEDSPELLTYTHGLVSSLPPVNYTRYIMNVIDHIYIGIILRSAHTLIMQHFSLFVTQHQRAHDRRFPRLRTTPHIMSIYWDHAKEYPDLLAALNCLRSAQDMKLYYLIFKAQNKVSVALLQRERNVQPIVDALVYNRTGASTRGRKKRRNRCAIPEPCGSNLVQTLLHAHMTNLPTNPPTSTPIFTTPKNRIPCEHKRCNLYKFNKMSKGFIIGRALFSPVCQIFNHAAKHTYHIERSLCTCPRPRLRHSLAKLTYIPEEHTTSIFTRLLLITLREYPAQDLSQLLNNLRSQHAHLVTTRPSIGDPSTENPQLPLTNVLHFVARTLDIPSIQHSIANPRPTATQQYERYIRAAAVCPCLVLKVSTPRHPRMCEHCSLLRHAITKSPTNDCPAYASSHLDNGSPSTCVSCIIFALIHQHIFAERWDDMQHNLAPTQPTLLHPSLNSPQSDHSASPAHTYEASPGSTHVPQPTSSASVVRHSIILVLPPHTHMEIQKVLTSNPSSPLCTNVLTILSPPVSTDDAHHGPRTRSSHDFHIPSGLQLAPTHHHDTRHTPTPLDPVSQANRARMEHRPDTRFPPSYSSTDSSDYYS